MSLHLRISETCSGDQCATPLSSRSGSGIAPVFCQRLTVRSVTPVNRASSLGIISGQSVVGSVIDNFGMHVHESRRNDASLYCRREFAAIQPG